MRERESLLRIPLQDQYPKDRIADEFYHSLSCLKSPPDGSPKCSKFLDSIRAIAQLGKKIPDVTKHFLYV